LGGGSGEFAAGVDAGFGIGEVGGGDESGKRLNRQVRQGR